MSLTHNSPEAKIASHNDSTLNIVQLTDLHLFAQPQERLLATRTEETFLSVLRLVQQQQTQPDLMILSGDLSQDGSQEAYERLQLHLSKLNFPCFCLPGNHDDPALMQTFLNSGNVKTLSAVQLKGWQLLFLNSKLPYSEGGRLAKQELTRLKKQLNSSPDKPTLIALHHPPLPVGSPWLDTMMLDNSAQLFEITQQHSQVKGLLLGHVHQEQDWLQNGLRFITTPSTCFQFKPQSADFALDPKPPGYRSLNLFPDGSIETKVYRLDSIAEGFDQNTQGY